MDAENRSGLSGEIWDWMKTLRGRDLTDAEVEAATERLLADRDHALPILLAQFADPEEDPALLAVATVTLKAWAEPYPVEPLTLLLRSPEVGALGKGLIMSVLERYRIDVDAAGLLGVGINLEEYELDPGGGAGGVSRN